jgi:glucose 1-dehydrogenase
MSLKNKVAVVTGGNSGIGMAIVLELAKQGANIVIDYVAHPEATESLEKQVTALGDQAIGVDADGMSARSRTCKNLSTPPLKSSAG